LAYPRRLENVRLYRRTRSPLPRDLIARANMRRLPRGIDRLPWVNTMDPVVSPRGGDGRG